MLIFLGIIVENSLFQLNTGNSFLVFLYILEKPTAAVGLTHVCSDQGSNNLPSFKNNQIHLLFFLKPDEWSNSRVVLKDQNKGTCHTCVGIVALLGILVKDRVRQPAYHCGWVRRSSRAGLNCFQLVYYVVGPKSNWRRLFHVLGARAAVRHQKGWEGEVGPWHWAQSSPAAPAPGCECKTAWWRKQRRVKTSGVLLYTEI